MDALTRTDKSLSAEKEALEDELLTSSLDGTSSAPAKTPSAVASASEPVLAATDVEEELEHAKATIAELRERTQSLLKEREAAVKVRLSPAQSRPQPPFGYTLHGS